MEPAAGGADGLDAAALGTVESCSFGGSSEPTNFVLVGNAGSGKSTILNCMLQKPQFASGTTGSCLTTVLGQHKEGIHTFTDTPALSDVKLRKGAAAAITSVLRQGGHCKVFFVVTLVAGRLPPQDKAMIELVLESAPITSYGVIVNKVSKRVCEGFALNPTESDPSPLHAALGDLWVTSLKPADHIHIMMKDEELEDASNIVVPLPADVSAFIEGMPGTTITPDEVKEIEAEKYDVLCEEFEKLFEQLRADKEVLRAEVNKRAVEAHRLSESRPTGGSGCPLQ